MSLDARQRLTPQMRAYDELGRPWVPHLMYFHEPDYSSEVVSTDARGFRTTRDRHGRRVDLESADGDGPLCVLAGGSTAFGVGATSDAATIPSLLTRRGDARWLNFGGRAFSSTQELLLFVFHGARLRGVRRVVLLSGVNNLLLFYLSSEYSSDYGAFFGASEHRPRGEPTGGLRGLLRPFTRTRAPRELVRPIRDHDAERNDLSGVIARDLHAWQLLARAMGFELTYALQPLAGWLDRRLAPEEVRLFAELDDHQGEAWCRVLREKMGPAQHAWLAATIGEHCRELGIRFVDVGAALTARRLDGRWLFVDRVHLTDEGHAHVAEILTEACA